MDNNEIRSILRGIILLEFLFLIWIIIGVVLGFIFSLEVALWYFGISIILMIIGENLQ